MSQLLDAIAGVPNASEPIPGIVTGGQPTLEHLAALKRAGCKVVIDIREGMEPQPFKRPEAVVQAGLEYRHIPVGHGAVSDATFGRLVDAVRELAVLGLAKDRPTSVDPFAGPAAAIGAPKLGGEPGTRDVHLTRLESRVRLVGGDVFPIVADLVETDALAAERVLEEHRLGREHGGDFIHRAALPPAAKRIHQFAIRLGHGAQYTPNLEPSAEAYGRRERSRVAPTVP